MSFGEESDAMFYDAMQYTDQEDDNLRGRSQSRKSSRSTSFRQIFETDRLRSLGLTPFANDTEEENKQALGSINAPTRNEAKK